jgi:hypothetical protein
VLRTCTGDPVGLDPAYTLTVTFAASPGAAPATPENVGVAVATVPPAVGWVSVGAGAVVSTVNVVGALVPVLPALSLCSALAV